MALQVKRAGAAEYGTFIKMVVLGNPGAGKTRTASTWPNVLYANCEGGMMSVADRQPAVVDISTSAEMRELINALNQQPQVRSKMLGVDVDTVVIDTLDEYARILIQERLASERKEAFSQPDWGWFGDQLRNVVRAMRNLPLNVIFNVHLKTQEDSETGRMFNKPAIQGAMSDELAAYVDLALLMVARPQTVVRDGKNARIVVRYFQTYPDAQHPWVKDRSGRMPLEFTVDFDSDYNRMHDLIYGSLPGASQVVGEIQVPDEQVPVQPRRKAGAAKEDASPPPEPQTPAPAPEPEAGAADDPGPQPEAESQPQPEPEPAPEPQPEPEPEPAPQPEVEAPAPPEPVTEPPVETETVPEGGTTPEPASSTAVEVPAAGGEPWETCQGCGGTVESKDQADLSFIRYKEHLCRKCFADKKKARR